ncbi:hypothetical protein B9Z55_028940 [Caenorhabditis nigoni]|uniref:Uncharacterized protein n=1 Tax=Caenorhabditis nigoni TaxID=1611254 RepID=A0A2G5S9E8_9PELO|nr:hypothetical protein B9Z55_028940 [Caenorhabditis nigoni]
MESFSQHLENEPTYDQVQTESIKNEMVEQFNELKINMNAQMIKTFYDGKTKPYFVEKKNCTSLLVVRKNLHVLPITTMSPLEDFWLCPLRKETDRSFSILEFWSHTSSGFEFRIL